MSRWEWKMPHSQIRNVFLTGDDLRAWIVDTRADLRRWWLCGARTEDRARWLRRLEHEVASVERGCFEAARDAPPIYHDFSCVDGPVIGLVDEPWALLGFPGKGYQGREWTTLQAAEVKGLTDRMIRKLCARGLIKHRRLTDRTRTLLCDAESVMAYKRRGTT